MAMWTTLPADKACAPQTLEAGVGTLDAVLLAVATHLSRGRHMSKERANLEALEEQCGTRYAQALAVPDVLFESLRSVFGIVPFVLLPPLDADDAVVLLADWHGALKGLPPNERANLLCQAAGTQYKVRGDVFIGRVRIEGGALVPGADVPPPMVMEREWLEAAQSANKVGAGREEGQQLGRLLGTYAAAAVAQVCDAAQASEPAAAAADHPGEDDEAIGLLEFRDDSTASDTAQSVTATVRVPAATKARDVTCEVTGGRLLLRVETLPAERQTIVDGELFQEIEDSSWALEDGKGGARLLTIELEKAAGLVGQMRWLSLTR